MHWRIDRVILESSSTCATVLAAISLSYILYENFLQFLLVAQYLVEFKNTVTNS